MKIDEVVISFPHLGNYYIPITTLFKNIFKNAKILVPPKMTKKTIELGEKYSPDFVCTPFKYNLGNFIESLELGANVLIQAGGGCRFGYYAEVQEKILKNLGYNFSFITLTEEGKINLIKIYRKLKKIDSSISVKKISYFALLAIKTIRVLDELENYIRFNISYEDKKGEFEKIHNKLLDDLKDVNTFSKLKKFYKKYIKILKNVKLKEDYFNNLKVGIVGELYTSMEPFSSLFLEKTLSDMGVHTKRYTTVTYLLFEKSKAEKKLLNDSKKYIKYALGADGTESVAHSIELCNKGYDGIIHIKPFGCTPEINAMPMLQRISNDYNIPIIYFTFDSQTSEVGIKTRLEAFYDMLKMKKEKEVEKF